MLPRRVSTLHGVREQQILVEEARVGDEPIPSVGSIEVRSDRHTRRADHETTRNRLLLMISDRFSKLARAIPMKTILAANVAHTFVTHCLITYGPPICLFCRKWKHFNAKLFQDSFCLLGAENLFTTTYHPQANVQVERFNRTILESLLHHISYHPKEW